MKKVVLLIIFVSSILLSNEIEVDLKIKYNKHNIKLVTKYFATNARVSKVINGVKRDISEKEGCYQVSYGSYNAPGIYKEPKIKVDEYDIKKNTFYKKILTHIKNNNCKYELFEISLQPDEYNEILLYSVADEDERYYLYIYDEPIKREYKILKNKNLKCFYDKNKLTCGEIYYKKVMGDKNIKLQLEVNIVGNIKKNKKTIYEKIISIF